MTLSGRDVNATYSLADHSRSVAQANPGAFIPLSIVCSSLQTSEPRRNEETKSSRLPSSALLQLPWGPSRVLKTTDSPGVLSFWGCRHQMQEVLRDVRKLSRTSPSFHQAPWVSNCRLGGLHPETNSCERCEINKQVRLFYECRGVCPVYTSLRPTPQVEGILVGVNYSLWPTPKRSETTSELLALSPI